MKKENQMHITDEWRLLEIGKEYKRRIKLYDTVNQNERFYCSDQWKGVVSNGLPTPVFNIFKRIIDYKIANILSQKIKMQYSPENVETDTNDPEGQELQKVSKLLSNHSEIKWEKLKMDSLLADGLLDGANSGDICAYTYWDDTIDTKQTYGKEIEYDENGDPVLDEFGEPKLKQVPIMGDFTTILLDNVNVFFGNPNDKRVNVNGKPNQPYILISGRDVISKLKAEAKNNGMDESEINKITYDVDYNEQSGDNAKIEIENQNDDNGKCSYLIKLWANLKTNTIWMNKMTRYATIRKNIDTKLRIYSIAWMNWSSVKNCYHGTAEGTGIVPNQIIINKLFAMIAKWMMDMAFGRLAYDKNRLPGGISNAIGVHLGFDGEIKDAIQQINPGQLNNAIFEVFDKAIRYTKEFLGATDTAMGEANPDNYKALVANMQQAAIPLENVKRNLYQFVEDIGLIWLEFMLIKYNIPRKLAYKKKNKVLVEEFDGSKYKDIGFSLKIDVGPSNYWSSLASPETLWQLLESDRINIIQYLERLQDGYITKKQELIDEIKAEMAQQNMNSGTDISNLPPEIQEKISKLPENQKQIILNKLKAQSSNQNVVNK